MKNFLLTFLLFLGCVVTYGKPVQKSKSARHHSTHKHVSSSKGRHRASVAKAKPVPVASVSQDARGNVNNAAQQDKTQNADIQNTISDARKQGLDIHMGSDNSIFGKYCSVLGAMPAAMGNLALYSFIDQWMGVHYRLGGTSKKGVDCSAFVQQLYSAVFNINMVRTAFDQFNFCKLVFDSDKLKEGDLVFFRIHHRKISHVGIYLINNYFVHASVSGGVMISSLNDPYWKKYFAGAGTIAKDANCANTF